LSAYSAEYKQNVTAKLTQISQLFDDYKAKMLSTRVLGI